MLSLPTDLGGFWSRSVSSEPPRATLSICEPLIYRGLEIPEDGDVPAMVLERRTHPARGRIRIRRGN